MTARLQSSMSLSFLCPQCGDELILRVTKKQVKILSKAFRMSPGASEKFLRENFVGVEHIIFQGRKRGSEKSAAGMTV